MTFVQSSNSSSQASDETDFATAVMDIVDQTYQPYLIFLSVWIAVVHVSTVVCLTFVLVQRRKKVKMNKWMSEIEKAVKYPHRIGGNTIRLQRQDGCHNSLGIDNADNHKSGLVISLMNDKKDRHTESFYPNNGDIKGSMASTKALKNDGNIYITTESVRTIEAERVFDTNDNVDGGYGASASQDFRSSWPLKQVVDS